MCISTGIGIVNLYCVFTVKAFSGRYAADIRCHVAVTTNCPVCPSLMLMLQNRFVACAMCTINCNDAANNNSIGA